MTAHIPGGQWRPYWELVRPPALCTAAADSLCAFAWVSQVALMTSTWTEHILIALSLILISGSVYAAGMCTNDIFDLVEDQKDRPFRPLPSGKIKLNTAWRLALGLQVFALGMCGLLCLLRQSWSWLPLGAVLSTITMTYLYNSVFKNQIWAPIVMGTCRLGNFWIGASLIYTSELTLSEIDLSIPLYISCGTLAYVTALTALSRHEVEGGQKAEFWGGVLLLCSTHPLWWSFLNVFNTPLFPILIVGGLVFLWLLKKCIPLLKGSGEATAVQQMVSSGIRGVALTNVVLCMGLGSWPIAILLLLKSVLASKIGRWFYST